MKTQNTLFVLSLIAAFAAPSAFASRNAGNDLAEAFQETPPPGFLQDAEFKQVNWAQPPLGCVEEMVPHRSARACLDLSTVANPRNDWPAGISPQEKAYWWAERRGLNVCRMEEIMRREKAQPGSQPKNYLELAWMAVDSLRNYDVKVKAVYDSARANGIPLQVLTGAIYQESLFSELGIADDGGNFSCGVQQINLIGWCDYSNKQPAADKAAMGWPAEKVNCTDTNLIKLEYFRPIYNIAKTRLNGLPDFRLNKSHFQNIPLESFVREWPSAPRATQEARYNLIKSYINNCSDPRRGIMAKGNELGLIYNQHVTQALKSKDRYTSGQKFSRSCREPQVGDAYPLHTGWLLTIASYNAGPRAIDAAAHYNGWDRSEMNDSRVVSNFTPNDIVTSLFWAGRYNRSNDLIEFNGLNGTLKNWTWFKGCVAQRHIARVMQHVTLTPDFFVDTLEGANPCTRSTFGPGGELIQTAVPEFRQRSSGVK